MKLSKNLFLVLTGIMLFSAAHTQNLFIQNYTYQKAIIHFTACTPTAVLSTSSKTLKAMSPWHIKDQQLNRFCRGPCDHFMIEAYFPDQQKVVSCAPVPFKCPDEGPATLVIDDLTCRIVSN